MSHWRLRQQTDKWWDKRIAHHLKTRCRQVSGCGPSLICRSLFSLLTVANPPDSTNHPGVHAWFPSKAANFAWVAFVIGRKCFLWNKKWGKSENERTRWWRLLFDKKDQRPHRWLRVSHALIPKFLPMQLSNHEKWFLITSAQSHQESHSVLYLCHCCVLPLA